MSPFRVGGLSTKYRAVPTVVNGIRFDSKREAARYLELVLLGLAGGLVDLELQPRFDLHVQGIKVATYVADFRYREWQSGPHGGGWVDVVEDVKGVRTPVYRLKAKHLAAEHGIRIRETR